MIKLILTYLENREKIQPFDFRIHRGTFKGYHPSGMYDDCPRRMGFNIAEERGLLKHLDLKKGRIKDAKLEMIFDIGHVIHALFQESYIANYDETAECDVPIRTLKKYNIGGTADQLITLQDGYKYVVDYKTCRSEVFYKLSADNLKPNYVGQINLYMYALKAKGCILYINKNDQSMKEFFFDKVDKKIVNKMLGSALKATAFINGEKETEILPECLQGKGNYLTCDYAIICAKCKKFENIKKYTRGKVENGNSQSKDNS